MYVWKLNEDTTEFDRVLPAEIEADADGFYVVCHDGGRLTTRSDGAERPLNDETLTIAGCTFDVEQFNPWASEPPEQAIACGNANRTALRAALELDGFEIVATFEDGCIIRHEDALTLGALLWAAGVRADDVRVVDWHNDATRALSGGQKIAIFNYLRRRLIHDPTS